MKLTKPLFAALALVASVSASAAVPTNLLTNGSFEATVVSSNPGYSTLGASTSLLPGWTINSGSVDIVGNYWNAQDGINSVDLSGSAAKGVISQAFSTTAGQSYNVSYWLAGNPDDAVKLKTGTVSVGNQTQGFSFDATGKTHTNMGWIEKSFSFVASGSSSTLSFASNQLNTNGSLSSWGPALDNVSVSAVPEPETYAMLLAGLASVSLIVRRRKNTGA
jgi:choice-of-anchor C domain-containing protein